MNIQNELSAQLCVRIERLERAYRRWRLVSVVAGITLIGIGAIAHAQSQQTGPPIIKAAGFVLVNPAGQELAEFGFEDSLPALSFFDGMRHPMTKLSGLSLEIGTVPQNELGRVNLSIDGLSITGRKRQGVQEVPRLLISTESGPGLYMTGDTPTVELTDRIQRIALRAGGGRVPVTAWRGAASPSIELSDVRKKNGIVLGRVLSTSGAHGDVQMIEDSGIGLSLFDDAGMPRLQLLGGSYPNLAILDEAGSFRALFGRTLPFNSETPRDPYTATVLDGARTVEWQAPQRERPAPR